MTFKIALCKTALLSITGSLFGALSTHAASALSYTPSTDYVTHDTDFDRAAQTVSTAPFMQVCAFDSTSPLLRTSEYYKGPTFYGAYQLSSSLNKGPFSREQIRDGKDKPDAITLQSYSSQSWGGSELSLAAVFLFKQEDFIEPLDHGPFTPESFSVKWSSYFKGQNRDVTGRYLIHIGDTYYLSDTSINMTNSGSNMLSKYSLPTTLWAPYSPEVSINFDQDAANFTKLPLQNVNAVGIYFEEDSWTGDNSSSSPYVMSIYGFEANGTVE